MPRIGVPDKIVTAALFEMAKTAACPTGRFLGILPRTVVAPLLREKPINSEILSAHLPCSLSRNRIVLYKYRTLRPWRKSSLIGNRALPSRLPDTSWNCPTSNRAFVYRCARSLQIHYVGKRRISASIANWESECYEGTLELSMFSNVEDQRRSVRVRSGRYLAASTDLRCSSDSGHIAAPPDLAQGLGPD